MSNQQLYVCKIRYLSDDDLYEADIPELNGCSALGDTVEEALAELKKYLPEFVASSKLDPSSINVIDLIKDMEIIVEES